MCILNAVKMQSGIEFTIDALFGNFAYLYNLYTVVKLHTDFVLMHFGSQPCLECFCLDIFKLS